MYTPRILFQENLRERFQPHMTHRVFPAAFAVAVVLEAPQRETTTTTTTATATTPATIIGGLHPFETL